MMDCCHLSGGRSYEEMDTLSLGTGRNELYRQTVIVKNRMLENYDEDKG